MPEKLQVEEKINSATTDKTKRQKLDRGSLLYMEPQNGTEIVILESFTYDSPPVVATEASTTENKIEFVEMPHNVITYFPKQKTYSRNPEKKITDNWEIVEVNEEIDKSTETWSVEEIKEEIIDENNHPEANESSETYHESGRSLLKKCLLNSPNCNEEMKEYNDIPMLFEDLLEIYTEATLPQGWSTFVISKGHTMTIVYSCMNISISGVPYTEKQVFINATMHLRCGIMKKEIDPVLYNLVEKNRGVIVQSLSDVEDFIEIFDKSTICTGNFFSFTSTQLLRSYILKAITYL